MSFWIIEKNGKTFNYYDSEKEFRDTHEGVSPNSEFWVKRMFAVAPDENPRCKIDSETGRWVYTHTTTGEETRY